MLEPTLAPSYIRGSSEDRTVPNGFYRLDMSSIDDDVWYFKANGKLDVVIHYDPKKDKSNFFASSISEPSRDDDDDYNYGIEYLGETIHKIRLGTMIDYLKDSDHPILDWFLFNLDKLGRSND